MIVVASFRAEGKFANFRKMKTKHILILLVAAVLLCAGGFWLIKNADTGSVAVIKVDGQVRDKIDLSKVEDSYEIHIDTEYGHNTILVEPGAISVIDADCPDHVCVKQGKLTGGGLSIICMPHRLVIQIGGSDIDA